MYQESQRGKGSEHHDVKHQGFDDAFNAWVNAKEEKDKQKYALSVLSHAGAMSAKIHELIEDEQTINAIRADAERGL